MAPNISLHTYKRQYQLKRIEQKDDVHLEKEAVNKQTAWSESASELYRPSDRRLSAKFVPTFAARGVPRGQREGSLRPYSRFSRLKRLLFLLTVAPQLNSRG
jgi:hypothetical protein